jgi:hypothetical protein
LFFCFEGNAFSPRAMTSLTGARWIASGEFQEEVGVEVLLLDVTLAGAGWLAWRGGGTSDVRFGDPGRGIVQGDDRQSGGAPSGTASWNGQNN